MIHELRTNTLRPGSQPLVAQTSAELGRDIRGDNYGKLEGYWTTEIGTLNQVVHLWSFDSLDERAQLRAALAKNARWQNEYIPKLLDHLVRQEVRLLNPMLPIKAPEHTGNIYELRCYRARPTKVKAWAQLFTDAMPIREKYSRCSGAWVSEAGQPNEVVHLWAYPDLNARMQARREAGADPAWQAFVGQAANLLEEMQSTVMLPASHSRLQ